MTFDERNLLTELADKISQTPAPPRDPEAEEFIRSQIGKRPDALYLMTQTVLIQNMALQQAQKQLQELQQSRPANPGGSGSFLGQTYAPHASMPGGAPSFLRGAAQTAAGVAAGALAFEGIQALFSHHGYGMGGGSGFGGFGGGGFGSGDFGDDRLIDETRINNYYDGATGSPDVTGDDLRLGDNRDNFADSNLNDALLDDTTGNSFSSDLGFGDDGGLGDSDDDFA